MEYFFIVLMVIITTLIHWHYYRWKIFNPWPFNMPPIYRSNTGTLIIFISKVLLFGIAAIFFNLYLMLAIFIFFQILKFVAFEKALRYETKGFYIHLGRKTLGENEASKEVIDNKLTKEKIKEIEKEARETARNAVFKYKNKKLSGSFLSKIFYLIT